MCSFAFNHTRALSPPVRLIFRKINYEPTKFYEKTGFVGGLYKEATHQVSALELFYFDFKIWIYYAQNDIKILFHAASPKFPYVIAITARHQLLTNSLDITEVEAA